MAGDGVKKVTINISEWDHAFLNTRPGDFV